jgi:GNAT superfamily N-acetyltransferase
MALWRIRATVDDRPGYLSVLTASLALRGVNILAVQVHTTEAGAVDDFLVDTPDTMTEADLLAAVTRGRGRDAFVARAEAQGLADQPTRALALAARLVHDPDSLGEALVILLDAAGVSWRPAGRPAVGFAADRMTLVDPAGGSYDVVRRRPSFTPAEYARAQALVEVAGAALRQHAEQVTLVLPDGAELLIRPATTEDAAALRRLHAHCSPATLRSRYLNGGAPSEAQLARLLEPAGGLTLLAVTRPDAPEPAQTVPAPAEPIPTGPTPAEPSSAKPTSAKPTSAESSPAEPTAAGSGPGRPNPAWPGSAPGRPANQGPQAADATAEPGAVEPGAVEPGAVEPGHHEHRIVAMASLFAEGDLGETALLVQDDWQRRGIGAVLLRRLIAYAGRTGFEAVVAHARADNEAMLRTLRRVGGVDASEVDSGLVSVTLPVDRRPPVNDGASASAEG